MVYWSKIGEFEMEGFTMIVEKTYSDVAPADVFDEETPEQMAEIYDKIDRGIYEWFDLRVRATLNGHTMGESGVCAFLYEDADEVLKDGTAKDVAWEALQEAKEEVKRLQEKMSTLVLQ